MRLHEKKSAEFAGFRHYQLKASRLAGTASRKKKLTLEEQEMVYETMMREPDVKLLDGINVHLKCKSPNQKELAKLIKERDIVVCSGLPGSGKTYISCAVALELLKQQPDRFKKIVIIKSVTTVEDEEIGFIKGTQDEKMRPFMYSFIHNFIKLIGEQKVEELKMAGAIEELPIAYTRGINIDNAIIIIDEAQNLTKIKIKTLMTRLGEGSKLIFLGDVDQVDMKKPQLSALRGVMHEFSKDKYKDIAGTITFGEEDIVRHKLIKTILSAFEEIDKENQKN